LYGLRDEKYGFLREQKINTVKWEELHYTPPQFFFVQKNFGNLAKYEEGFQVQDLFLINSVGIVTANDRLFINKCKKLLKVNINKHYYEFVSVKIRNISYRPFDTQYIYYDTGKLERPREKVMQHFFNSDNLGLAICSQYKTGNFYQHVFITNKIAESSLISNRTSEITSIFPLYLYEGKKRRPNLNPKVITEIEQKLNLTFKPESAEPKPPYSANQRFDVNSVVNNKTFTPFDLFDYIYAVLHSPSYRETYREFLKIDFPRIPYPVDTQAFWKLVALGRKLRLLHLLEDPVFEKANDADTSGKILKVKCAGVSRGNGAKRNDLGERKPSPEGAQRIQSC
jgi:predicted helicase